MDKQVVANVLNEICVLLELKGENAFRCNAYRNAARAIEQMEGDLAAAVAAGKLSDIPGIGATLQEKITVLVTTGSLPFYEELRQATPAGLIEMLRLPGIGPKKVKALYDTLKIDDIAKLRLACEHGEVAELKGFGKKTEQKILEGIEFLDRVGKRVRIDEAWELASTLLEALRGCKEIKRLELCGSLRRRKETINDIDILASSEDPAPIMDRFVKLRGVLQVVGHGETKSSVMFDRELEHGRRVLMNADLRVVLPKQFPFALHYFTGSKEHNIAVRARAQHYGLKLNEYELAGADKSIPCKEEEDIFRALDLDYIPPELRECTGEIEAAEKHRLPRLVTTNDLHGTFHCHTTYSDGTASVKEMAQAAQKLGYKYLGIGDHSQSLTVANGLTPERVRQQHTEIDKLNGQLKGFRVFKGTECDILADGRLDFDDQTLESFEYVVASVHSHFNMTSEEMTARIIRAISHPRVSILGHATGRLLLRRDGYKVDLEAVLQAAAKHGTMVEINAHPQRLDIDWIHCKRAKALGVKLVVNPDAHGTEEIGYTRYGVDVARRGWLEKKDVFNTMSTADVAKAFEARKSS